MGHYKDLLAYKKGYELAMEIFTLSKKFPNEEKYSLTDQIRRSSIMLWQKAVNPTSLSAILFCIQ